MSNQTDEILGHPKGLFYLFFAELWERFSFYGMRALLVLYIGTELYKDLMNGEEIAYEIYAAYGALVYFTPAIGGMIADRLIGHKNSIMLGGILMCLGHFIMAYEQETVFFIALGFLIIGNGFFKPNISSLVGGLYDEKDPRRDNGFTIFYMGINLGAFLSPLICGWLGHSYGWHYGFAAAGVGMLVGLIVFWKGIKKNIFGDQGHQPEAMKTKNYFGFNVKYIVYILAFLSVPLFAFLVNKNAVVVPFFETDLMGFLLWTLLILVIVYLIVLFATKLDRKQIFQIISIVILTFFITIFWAFFEQGGSSLTIFAENNVDLVILNAAQTNSINAGYIVLLAIPFSLMWGYLSKKKKNPNSPVKFGLAILQLGLGFVFFAMSGSFMSVEGMVPMVFLMLGYLFITTGELFCSPIGLSKVTQLSPGFLVSFMMGVWFLSSSFAHHISGIIAKMTIPDQTATEYVADEGFLTGFASSISGTDQNAAGAFSFAYNKAYLAMTDTAKNATSYPSEATYHTYLNTFDLMKGVNESWAAASASVKAKANKVKDALATLSEFKEDKALLKEYQNYNRAFQTMVTTKSYRNTYQLFKDKEAGDITPKEFDHDYAKIPKNWKTKTDDFRAMEQAMLNKNKAWAKACFNYNVALEEHKAYATKYETLASSTKVYGQIALISFIFGLFAIVISPLLKRMMGGVH